MSYLVLLDVLCLVLSVYWIRKEKDKALKGDKRSLWWFGVFCWSAISSLLTIIIKIFT